MTIKSEEREASSGAASPSQSPPRSRERMVWQYINLGQNSS